MKFKLLLIIQYIIFSSIILVADIILSPVKAVLLYDNYENDLYPFKYSTKTVKLDNTCELKLLDQIEYSNGFNKDILKVEVINGNNKGSIGYLFEDNITLCQRSNKNDIYLFFKEDTIINNIAIQKNTKCKVIDSKFEDNKEILTLLIINSIYKDQVIICNNKSDLQFIINKESEILYYFRKGYTIIKIVDTATLMPIENAIYNNQKSDKSGFLYLNLKNENKIIIKKNYYQDCIVLLTADNKIILAFMKKLENESNNKIFQNNDFSLVYDSNEITINLNNPETLDILSSPVLNNNNFIINSGFYLKIRSKSIDTFCTVYFLKNNLKIIYFNIDSLKWEELNLIKKDDKILSNIKQEGYYFIISKDKTEYNDIKIIKNNFTTSNIFFRDKKTNFYFQYNLKDAEINLLSLPKNKFELLIFTPAYPFDILHDQFSNINDIPSINLKYLTKNIKQDEYKGFYYLFNGNWKRRGISFNNKIVQDDKTKVEYLGDLNIESDYQISFSNKNNFFQGFVDILDNKRLNIYINKIEKICFENITMQNFFIDPSIFNSQMIIPAYYSFKAGILELDFDNVYFIRKNNFNKNESHFKLEIESYTLNYPPKFPKADKNSVYKIYFTQQ